MNIQLKIKHLSLYLVLAFLLKQSCFDALSFFSSKKTLFTKNQILISEKGNAGDANIVIIKLRNTEILLKMMVHTKSKCMMRRNVQMNVFFIEWAIFFIAYYFSNCKVRYRERSLEKLRYIRGPDISDAF